MFFDEDNVRLLHAEICRPFFDPILADALINPDFLIREIEPREIPTHTEDGIPIRKLYVSNLPAAATRSELFCVFAQYGFITSCWMRICKKAPHKPPTPTYAFITFRKACDAHKALAAPSQDKLLHGRFLHVSPADSWHQPFDEDSGRSKNNAPVNTIVEATSSSPANENNSSQEGTSEGASEPDTTKEDKEETFEYNMLDILNTDCLAQVFQYISIRDLIRSERVSTGWRDTIREYLHGIHTYKTSWWQHEAYTLTTAVLRSLLQRIGPALLRLHIDHHGYGMNDRTAHVVGKFCPQLEEFQVVGMHTHNWNPLVYGCKNLKSLSFIGCNELTDFSLVYLFRSCFTIENLLIASNTQVTGSFLSAENMTNLKSLSFKNCYSLEGGLLASAVHKMTNLTILELDSCPANVWKELPEMSKKLPKLEVLSATHYEPIHLESTEDLTEREFTFSELKTLKLSRNGYVSNNLLKQIARACPKLESLDVSGCNSTITGVTDEGIAFICRQCPTLKRINISFLTDITDSSIYSIASCSLLLSLCTMGNKTISTAPLVQCIKDCQMLREVDATGCENVGEAIFEEAKRQVENKQRSLCLRLGGTAAAGVEKISTCKNLTVDLNYDERYNYMFDGSDLSDSDYVHQYDDVLDDSIDSDGDDYEINNFELYYFN